MSVLLCAQKDLARLRRQPASLALWIGIPVIIGGLLTLANGGGGGAKPQAQLFVADADDSVGSRMLVTALEQSGMVRVERLAEPAARARLGDGEGSALLVVPAGFAADVLHDRPTELVLATNPSQRILPGIVESMLGMGKDATFYVQKLVAPEAERIRASIDDLQSAKAWSVAWAARSTELTARLQPYVDPLRIELVDRTERAAKSDAQAGAQAAANGAGGFARVFWPGMLLMALLFVAQGLGEDLWVERRLGTLRRAVASPGGVRPWLLGKVLCSAVVAATVGAVGLGAGALMLDLPLTALWLGVPWMAVIGIACVLLLWPLSCAAASARAANALVPAVMFPLLMLGGSFFPFEWMPGWMADVGRWTPNGWLLLRLRALVDGHVEPVPLLAGVAGVALLACVVVPFCERRLVRAVAS